MGREDGQFDFMICSDS